MADRNDFETAAKDFAARVIADVHAVDLITRLAGQYDTVAEVRHGDADDAAALAAALDTLGIGTVSDDDADETSLWDVERVAREYVGGYGAGVEKVVTVTLAGGGPSGWIEFRIDTDNEVTGATVFYCDWFETPYPVVLSGDDLDAAEAAYRPVDLLAAFDEPARY